MSDVRRDPDLEAALRSAFRSADLPAAPGRLADALEQVPDAPLTVVADADRRGRRRTTLGLLGLAAVLLVGGGLALSGGGLLPRPAPTTPTPGPRITYRVVWTDVVPSSADSLAAEVAAVRTRIDATGAVGATVASEAPDSIIVTLPLGFDMDAVRALLAQAGRVAFVPLGDNQTNDGDVIDPARFPALFGGEGLADARVDVDQQGRRVLDLTLAPAAARLFGDYTASHVGSIFAITLDNRVVSAPRIMSAIPGGDVQISQGGSPGGWDAVAAAQLVAVLHSPLPAALVEVAIEPGPALPTSSPPASRSVGSLDATASDPSRPQATASPFPLGSPTYDFGCGGRPGYTSVVIHVDPSLAEPVWAIAEDGRRLRVVFGPSFHTVTSPIPEIINGFGAVSARDGTTIDLATGTSPGLGGWLVLCATATELRILDVRPD